jgi:DNA-binding MarR family transcriptional regulator
VSGPDVPIPQMMREAREAYRDAVRQGLADAACDDIPRNGALVLAGFDPDDIFRPQAEVVASLGLSKQAASQLIDTLVLREYLERRNDPDDRRRMGLRLTDRGRRAATAIRTAADTVDTALAQLVTRDQLGGFRAALAAYKLVREQQKALNVNRLALEDE